MKIRYLEDFLRLLKRTKKYVKWHTDGVIRGELRTSLRLGGLYVKAFSPEESNKAEVMRICPVTAVALLKGRLLDITMIDWAADLFEHKSLMQEIVHASDYTEQNSIREAILKVLS